MVPRLAEPKLDLVPTSWLAIQVEMPRAGMFQPKLTQKQEGKERKRGHENKEVREEKRGRGERGRKASGDADGGH